MVDARNPGRNIPPPPSGDLRSLRLITLSAARRRQKSQDTGDVVSWIEFQALNAGLAMQGKTGRRAKRIYCPTPSLLLFWIISKVVDGIFYESPAGARDERQIVPRNAGRDSAFPISLAFLPQAAAGAGKERSGG